MNNFPFTSPFLSPFWTGDSLELGRAGTQVPSQLGFHRLSLKPGIFPGAITQHALFLTGEAAPSCFQSFITVLFVVQQIKFFGGWGGSKGGGEEKGGQKGEKIQVTPIRPKRLNAFLLNTKFTCFGEQPASGQRQCPLPLCA